MYVKPEGLLRDINVASCDFITKKQAKNLIFNF